MPIMLRRLFPTLAREAFLASVEDAAFLYQTTKVCNRCSDLIRDPDPGQIHEIESSEPRFEPQDMSRQDLFDQKQSKSDRDFVAENALVGANTVQHEVSY
jgi:hypothetical protein